MSYVGYIPLVKNFFVSSLPSEHAPTLLEVGIDRGTTLIPLVAFLARTRQAFLAVGVDVMVQEQVQLMLMNLDLTNKQQAFCLQKNSLEALPELVKNGLKFDVLLLDGDHNYHTVSEELKYLEDLTHPHSVVIIDDYNGRWADRDLWYAERAGYESVDQTTKRVETEKHGVRPAVDEWLESHPGWKKEQPIQGEPIVLMRKAI